MAQSIPIYYAPIFRLNSPVPSDHIIEDPNKIVDRLNQKITEFDANKTDLIYKTSALALLILAGTCVAISLKLGFVITLPVTPYLFLIYAIAVTCIGISLTLSCYEKRENLYQSLSQETALFTKGNFAYLEQIYNHEMDAKDLILTADEFAQIKDYLPQSHITDAGIFLKVRHQTVYEPVPGHVDFWSASPFSIKEQGVTSNIEKVREKYRPWIELLLSIATHDKIPGPEKQVIGRAVGCMIHQPNLFENQALQIAVHRAKHPRLSYCYARADQPAHFEGWGGQEKGSSLLCSAEECKAFLEAAYEISLNSSEKSMMEAK